MQRIGDNHLRCRRQQHDRHRLWRQVATFTPEIAAGGDLNVVRGQQRWR